MRNWTLDHKFGSDQMPSSDEHFLIYFSFDVNLKCYQAVAVAILLHKNEPAGHNACLSRTR